MVSEVEMGVGGTGGLPVASHSPEGSVDMGAQRHSGMALPSSEILDWATLRPSWQGAQHSTSHPVLQRV